jgi:putrescine transport system permease protein
MPISGSVGQFYPTEAYIIVNGHRRKAMADQITTVSTHYACISAWGGWSAPTSMPPHAQYGRSSTCEPAYLAADDLADRLLRLPVRADSVLVVLSFNASRLVTAWDGFSLRWYATLWHDQTLIAAALLSLRIAARRVGRAAGAAGGDHRSVAAAVVRCLAAGDRVAYGPRCGDGDAGARLGLGRLCGSRGAGAADRHTGRSGGGGDGPLCPTLEGVRLGHPVADGAGADFRLLAFTLSLDDVVVASFTSGPGASTLPMVVFSSIKLGPAPKLYALATVIVAAVAGMLLGAWRAQRSWTVASDRRRAE